MRRRSFIYLLQSKEINDFKELKIILDIITIMLYNHKEVIKTSHKFKEVDT